MQNDMLINDYQLSSSDIGQLENADEVARFFARLGYNIDTRIPLPDYGAIGLGSEDLRQQIHKIELIGRDPEDGDIIIYLLEVRSITAKLRNEIARRFRDRPENVLLVLTKDYEELEFVLLDRSVSRGGGRGLGLKQTVRPIPLTVNRRNPEPIALRVLKRFTFTEADAAYQWEKLRSAYMLAEWSEEYFNNRALFSDYYLKQRLTDAKLTPEWAEDVRPVGRAAYSHIQSARTKYTQQPEAVIRTGMYEPLFKQLGFAYVAQKAGDSAADMPDYLLYAPGDTKPIAAALTYVWNRNLDDADETRDKDGTPSEIPGAIVVSLLEKQVAPWVIVTNGKLWRLYSATASNKATNYYEVDLEEAIAASDQITALKYWWLMFRCQAFTGFLDSLLKNSAEYAKALGDRLKDRVFTEIFPQFARGFIADMRTQPGEQPSLDVVFSGTMTFLYRLMFVLYAESLDLLPVQEARGYQEQSMQRLKREIATKGGTLRDESKAKLEAAYSAKSTELYGRLNELFAVIDKGSDELNMPTYNGGLFSPHGEGGEFLTNYAIPDRFLALGLDKLARDLDDRTKALVFIDFKSLGVRQLGSIYEGLLEFKLKIAAEKLAVTKEKGKEVYQPFAAVKKPLVVVEKGDVYLENDKRERKATGSYYTPDYIVKYIVQHTVGPVLDRKFAELTPRLRAAQKNYRDYAKLVEARRKANDRGSTKNSNDPRGGGIYPAATKIVDSPDTFWNNPDMQQLVDDCLNVRVVDPAMGSGHFLVEVVDYVSNRLISFLNGWSENPVWAMIERTREDILGEMERQRVTIDAERLTRVALLKRAVLKRCVYGVDLNLMAVELAKVSLWLDAFTLGAPLNFLDHHLKHGNSLIGARIGEVQTYVEAGSGETMDMFSGSRFAGVMLATDLMRQVSYLSDNTVAQARASADAYRDASDHLAPFKRLLDVYTSRWFGNQTAKKKSDYVRLFLQEPQTENWLRDPNTTLDNSLIPASQIATTATSAAADKRFFHWELEFPEVFFAPATSGGQDVQLRDGGGFDAVVGNPPWEKIDANASEKVFLQERFSEIIESEINFFTLFLYISKELLASGSTLGMLVPYTWLINKYDAKLRFVLLKEFQFNELVYMAKNVFKDAPDAIPLIYLAERNDQRNTLPVKVKVLDSRLIDAPDFMLKPMITTTAQAVVWQSRELYQISVYDTSDNQAVLQKLETSSNFLRNYGWASDGIYKSTVEEQKKAEKDLPDDKPVVESASQTHRYTLDWDGAYIGSNLWHVHKDLHAGGKIVLHAARKPTMAVRVVATYTEEDFYFSNRFILIKPKVSNVISPLYLTALLNSSAINFYFRMRFPLTDIDAYMLHQLPIRTISFTTPPAERAALVAATSAAYAAGDTAGALAQARHAIDLGKTDIVHDLLAQLAQQMIDLNKQKQAEVKRFLGWLEGRLQIKAGKGSKATASQGRDISRRNENGDSGEGNEINEPSSQGRDISRRGENGEGGETSEPSSQGLDISSLHNAGIDSLPGKSILQNYLGDYQKNERELPWRDFFFRLHQNRNRFNVSLSNLEGEIEQEYERSLGVLLPIKRDLARTDALIDKIVYRLYGLTDDEIELIERPQYQQALTEAKRSVVADETITDDDARIAQIGENVLRAAEQYFARVEPTADEQALDVELPGWRDLPPDSPTFLLTGDYNLRTLPEQMDFSTSVVSYTKAVEVTLYKRIFAPFRDSSGYSDADCNNNFLRDFMTGKKHLTLGSFMIILSSSKETALRSFIASQISDAAQRVFGPAGMVTILNDKAMGDKRNDAAHDEVLSRADAQGIRAWAFSVLALV